VGAEVELAAAAVADVRVKLCRRDVGVAEHLLDAAEIGTAFEQVSRERVSEQMGVDPLRLEPGLLGQPAEYQEHSGPGQASTLGIEEELGPVSPVEVRAPAREVTADRVRGGTPERDDPFLRALAGRSDEALLEIDIRLTEADCFSDPQPGAVEKLDQGAIAECTRRRTGRGIDQALGFGGRERAREPARFAR
jgi:hypothetical protein